MEKGKKPRKPGPGRPKGSPNKITKDVKEAILAALDKVGGMQYLATVAITHPQAFCALLGKVMPLQVAGDPENPLRLHAKLEFAIIDAANAAR